MCESAARIEAGENSFAIARLTTGYVTLCATQYFRGYTFFAARSAYERSTTYRLGREAHHGIGYGRDGETVRNGHCMCGQDNARSPSSDVLNLARPGSGRRDRTVQRRNLA